MNTTKVAVDDSVAVVLFGSTEGSGETRLLVRNLGPDTCWLGDSAVDTDAFPLEDGEVLNLSPARRQDILYGICGAAETADVRVLWT